MNKGVKQFLQIIVMLGIFASMVTIFYFVSRSMGSSGMRSAGIAIGLLLFFIGGLLGFKFYRKRKIGAKTDIPLLKDME